MKYRKRPVVIEAKQWTGKNSEEVMAWINKDRETRKAWLKQKLVREDSFEAIWFLVIPTLEGDQEASVGDFIIRVAQGEFYPYKPDIFAETYVPVESHDNQS